jgi:hypothetical protein
VADAGGYYDYWETGSRATLREHLVNEGLAVHASQAVAPGFRMSDYLGYVRRQYNRLRELEAFLGRAIAPYLDQAGLGLRLRRRWDEERRGWSGKVIPERSGYYLVGGHRGAVNSAAAGAARAWGVQGCGGGGRVA